MFEAAAEKEARAVVVRTGRVEREGEPLVLGLILIVIDSVPEKENERVYGAESVCVDDRVREAVASSVPVDTSEYRGVAETRLVCVLAIGSTVSEDVALLKAVTLGDKEMTPVSEGLSEGRGD